jgi:hypothetical protein
MGEMDLAWCRFAVFATLAEQAPSKCLGRTALMKFAYFLQEARGVPLGYDFTLYSYGPFDSALLNDLDYAQTLGAVTVTAVSRGKNYGYDIQPGEKADEIKAKACEFLARYRDDFDWVIAEFGNLRAVELELASTIVYADREALAAGEKLTLRELTRRVLAVKPRFTESEAGATVDDLLRANLLQTVQRPGLHSEWLGQSAYSNQTSSNWPR